VIVHTELAPAHLFYPTKEKHTDTVVLRKRRSTYNDSATPQVFFSIIMSSPPGSPKKNRMRSLLANSFRRPRSQSHSHSSSMPNEGARLGSAQSGTPSAINPAVSQSSAGPNIPSTSEPDSAKLGRTRGKAALTGFRTSLEVLRDNAGVFPPLSSAAGILLSCIEGIEVRRLD
jgi:hypothetical protein